MSILHASNPTTSLGHPYSYSGIFLRTKYHSNSTDLSDSGLTNDRWLLDNDLVLGEPSYIDNLLGLHDKVDDEIAKVLNNDSTTSNIFFGGRSHQHLRHICRQVLVQKIPEIGIRYWDATIFLVNFIFFIFLLAKVVFISRRKLKNSIGSTMFREFFVLIFIMTLLNMAHAAGSMTLSLTNQVGSIIDQAVWFALKFSLFTTEICILFFGLCFGQSSTARGVCCGFFIAVIFAMIHSAFQSIFDFRLWDEYINMDFLRAYGYEQVNFWVVSSAIIAIIYLLIGFIPLICCRHTPCVLHRCSFFAYCILMSILNFAQAFGAVLIHLECPDGLCIADIVTLTYFTLFAPIVYFLFLRGLTRINPNRGLFSYRTHKNDPSSEANGYYPRFSGLISPSYDDLFDYDRIMQQDNTHMNNILHLNYDFYHNSPNDPHNIPLMMTHTPDSTLTNHMDSDPNNPEPDLSTSSESRPIIRAPYTQSSFGNYNQGHRNQQQYRPNLQVRPDGQLTFSSTSQTLTE